MGEGERERFQQKGSVEMCDDPHTHTRTHVSGVSKWLKYEVSERWNATQKDASHIHLLNKQKREKERRSEAR